MKQFNLLTIGIAYGFGTGVAYGVGICFGLWVVLKCAY